MTNIILRKQIKTNFILQIMSHGHLGQALGNKKFLNLCWVFVWLEDGLAHILVSIYFIISIFSINLKEVMLSKSNLFNINSNSNNNDHRQYG